MIERRTFRYPLEPCPTIAVVSDTLQVPRNCYLIDSHSLESIGLTGIDTIAAPANRLLGFELSGWRPAFPLVAFTGLRHGFLDEGDRNALWRRFGVPVFEQLLDDEGRVVAIECEAHGGLHLEQGVQHSFAAGELIVNGRPTGVSVVETNEMCGCGLAGTRLSDPCAAVRQGADQLVHQYLAQPPSFSTRITAETS